RWRDPSREVVPVDLEIAPDRPLLLITGPNAGGKTIALKTLALLALMTQIGCHVPAAEASRVPVFERLFPVIGDDQSVAENLSTFSAFIKQTREVLAEAEARSLVLLDELGAGTDPDEGAALARAILESLADRGALVVATTHLEPLRAFAAAEPRARNASVEFDASTLAPTFRLVYDRPGQSWALALAARPGLPPALVPRPDGPPRAGPGSGWRSSTRAIARRPTAYVSWSAVRPRPPRGWRLPATPSAARPTRRGRSSTAPKPRQPRS